MKKERVRTKRGFKGFGIFLLGWFIGLISTLGALVGVGFWAYTSINIRKIEKWTKNDITTNESLEKLTIKKAVGIIQGITSNGSDAYSINKLEEDFGVRLLEDSIYGISTDILKNAPIKDLKDALDDTIDSITFNNVLSFMDISHEELGLLDTVLEKNKEYYIYNGKLYSQYKDNVYSEEVGFTYEIKDDTVEFSNGSHTISIIDGVRVIKPRLSDMPIGIAVTSINDVVDDLEIYQILDYERTGTEGNYKYFDNDKEVSAVMASIAGFTVGELSSQDTFNDIYMYEVLGYKDEGNGEFSYTNDQNEKFKVTGAMKVIAGKTFGEISDPDTINTLKLYEIMGYYKVDDEYYEEFDGTNYDKKVTGVMKTFAGKTIEDLSDSNLIDDLQVWEVMGYDRIGTEGNYTYEDNGAEVTGIMETLAGKTIGQLGDAGMFNDITVADAMGYYEHNDKYYKSYDKDTNTYSDEVTGIYAHIASAKVSALSTRINELTVGEVLDMEKEDTSGVIKALHGLKINELSNKDTINNIYIWQVMDYTEVSGGGYTYVDSEGQTQTVSGAMSVLAGKTIGDLSNPDTIGNLKVYEVLGYYENGGKYYATYNASTGTYSDEVRGAIKALAGKSISDLNDETNGINSITLGEILDIDGTSVGVINALKGVKLGELESEINDLKIYQVMGYYENGGKYYTNYNEDTKTYSGEVTGIMGAIAGSTVNGISGTIDTLTAVSVLGEDCALLNLFEADKDTILITELSDKLVEEITAASVEDLVNSGIIELSETEKSGTYYNKIKGYKIKDIILGNFNIG